MKKLLFILWSFVAIGQVQGQVETRIYSDRNLNLSQSLFQIKQKSPVFSLPLFDISKMLAEDEETVGLDIPFRFGKGFDVNLTLEDGSWADMGDCRVWSMSFKSEGAHSLNFVFNNFQLPDGGELYIVNQGGNIIYGPVTSDAIGESKFFLTDIIPDSVATIYLKEPKWKRGESSLSICRVVHGYKSVLIDENGGLVGSSSPCNNDVACFPEYSKEAKAVALVLLSSGEELCSGSLVMTTDFTLKPYFLTAFHCIDLNKNKTLSDAEISNAENWMFKFNYMKLNCGNSTLATSYTYNSSTFRAGYNPTDFALVELNSAVDTNKHNWLGWDNTGTTPTNGVGIHHPAGDLMKISIENDSFSTVSWDQGPNNHWHVNFDSGVVEGGSSGSPLLNEHKKLVGQLHGGPEYINNRCLQTEGLYGKLSESWTGGGTNSTRLSNWLDPLSTGISIMPGSYDVTIKGSDILCNSNVYYIPIPNTYTITWSLSGGESSKFTVLNNTPLAGHCTITRNSGAVFSSNHFFLTLTATISSGGTIVKTLTKSLLGNTGFSPTYSETENVDYSSGIPVFTPAISETPVTNPNEVYVYKGGTVRVKSGYFWGKEISYTGPCDLFHFIGRDEFRFILRNDASTSNPFIVTVHENGCDDEKTFRFYPLSYSPYYTPHVVRLNEDEYRISLMTEEDLLARNVSSKEKDPNNIPIDVDVHDVEWTVEASEVITGRGVFSVSIKGTDYVLDTKSWKRGIYVLRIKVDDKVVYSCKIEV